MFDLKKTIKFEIRKKNLAKGKGLYQTINLSLSKEIYNLLYYHSSIPLGTMDTMLAAGNCQATFVQLFLRSNMHG